MFPPRILIVDDNQETLETIAFMVRSMDLGEISTATSVATALQTINQTPDIKLIICDWNMPEQSGIELLHQLRREGNLTTFVMVTARSDIESVLSANRKGVDLYICKPFSSEELKRKLNWAIKSPPRALHAASFSDND